MSLGQPGSSFGQGISGRSGISLSSNNSIPIEVLLTSAGRLSGVQFWQQLKQFLSLLWSCESFVWIRDFLVLYWFSSSFISVSLEFGFSSASEFFISSSWFFVLC